MIFRYLQLSHTFQAQFHVRSLDISQFTLERYLRQPGLQKAISWIYAILQKSSGSHVEGLHLKWVVDISAMDEDAWKGVREQISQLTISNRDRLIQIKFFNRVYLTPRGWPRFIRADPCEHRLDKYNSSFKTDKSGLTPSTFRLSASRSSKAEQR
ncbi:hypothetical protein XELAEV_18008283mg [Xenopus laevis]|uniref:Uncharacterized protein n=1 Tax=Xenopus laevis TaxID=8355 RepID=A0A974E2C3_XENLA|nr:hypothetical protein XELAEV_18008283mg [Xenopus laevis]